MAEGADRSLWNHTASVIAMLVNVNRDPKKSPVPAWRFHPYEAGEQRKQGIPLTAGNIGLLKKVFVERRSET